MVNHYMLALLRDVAILFPAFLVVFTFRGFFKALIAKLLGDDTGQRQGFLSLNPLAHVDIVGLCVVLFVVYLLGWLLSENFSLFGSYTPLPMLYTVLIFLGVRWVYRVPIEPRNFKHPRFGPAITMLSGSLGCFITILVFLYAIRYLPVSVMSLGAAKSLLYIFNHIIILAAYYGILALLPIPPFDGGRFLQFILPADKQRIVSWLEEYSLFIVLGLFLIPFVNYYFFTTIHGLGAFVVKVLSTLVI